MSCSTRPGGHRAALRTLGHTDRNCRQDRVRGEHAARSSQRGGARSGAGDRTERPRTTARSRPTTGRHRDGAGRRGGGGRAHRRGRARRRKTRVRPGHRGHGPPELAGSTLRLTLAGPLHNARGRSADHARRGASRGTATHSRSSRALAVVCLDLHSAGKEGCGVHRRGQRAPRVGTTGRRRRGHARRELIAIRTGQHPARDLVDHPGLEGSRQGNEELLAGGDVLHRRPQAGRSRRLRGTRLTVERSQPGHEPRHRGRQGLGGCGHSGCGRTGGTTGSGHAGRDTARATEARARQPDHRIGCRAVAHRPLGKGERRHRDSRRGARPGHQGARGGRRLGGLQTGGDALHGTSRANCGGRSGGSSLRDRGGGARLRTDRRGRSGPDRSRRAARCSRGPACRRARRLGSGGRTAETEVQYRGRSSAARRHSRGNRRPSTRLPSGRGRQRPARSCLPGRTCRGPTRRRGRGARVRCRSVGHCGALGEHRLGATQIQLAHTAVLGDAGHGARHHRAAPAGADSRTSDQTRRVAGRRPIHAGLASGSHAAESQRCSSSSGVKSQDSRGP